MLRAGLVAAGGVVTATLLLVLMDPMLVYLVLALTFGALFPDWWMPVAVSAVAAMHRISVTHDPMTCDWQSFVVSVAAGVDQTVTWTANMVAAFAMIPLFRGLMDLDKAEVLAGLATCVPLLAVLYVRTLVDTQANLSDRARQTVEYVGGWARSGVSLFGAIFKGA